MSVDFVVGVVFFSVVGVGGVVGGVVVSVVGVVVLQREIHPFSSNVHRICLICESNGDMDWISVALVLGRENLSLFSVRLLLK